MHLADDSDDVPVHSIGELVRYFVDACKPASAWRVGTEHELIGVIRASGEAPPYDGPSGIGTLLEWFAARGGTPIREDGHIIALSRADAQLTIEPGGQFELAARPIDEDHEFVTDLRAHVEELGAASREMGLAWLVGGLRPFGTRADIPWMPKLRYAVMRAYMPTVGTRGRDMMQRTTTVQANFDFSDVEDAAAKLRCTYSITSLLTALWASSPIVDEQVSGFQSYREWIWRDTDPARAGLLPFVFESGDLFTAYTNWALDVPMYFVYRRGRYHTVPAGLTFRHYMNDGWNGERATGGDWAMHLSTLFPEGRLKKFIEVRGCDCGSLEMISALGPLMRGLLYDPTARDAAIALTANLTFAERLRLADDVPRQGLAARTADGHTVGALAKELVAIARDGLTRVAPASIPLIAPVEEIAHSGRTEADRIVELWNANAGDRAALISALAHPGLDGAQSSS